MHFTYVKRKNVTSFANVITVNDITRTVSYDSTAIIVLGLVEDDNVWLNSLSEAAVKNTPCQ